MVLSSFPVEALGCIDVFFMSICRHAKFEPFEAYEERLSPCSLLYPSTWLHGMYKPNNSTCQCQILHFTDMGIFLQFGKAIVCSDAAAEAARYGFTAVDRPEGFLVLAVASLGDDPTENKEIPEVYMQSLF